MKIGALEFVTYFGDEEGRRTPYLTRLVIGRARLHIFHRGDRDPDPHDHRAGFWTFPLRGYFEEVWTCDYGCDEWVSHINYVMPFWPHYRSAYYTHRVLDRADRKPIITLSWWDRPRRDWGFRKVRDPLQCWVTWRRYLHGDGKSGACE